MYNKINLSHFVLCNFLAKARSRIYEVSVFAVSMEIRQKRMRMNNKDTIFVCKVEKKRDFKGVIYFRFNYLAFTTY